MEIFICKREVKCIQFTKGNEYFGVSDDEGGYYIQGDDKINVHFFDYTVLFELTTCKSEN